VLQLSRRFGLASGTKKMNFSKWKSASGQAGKTTVQVWTVEEGFGIGGEFRQTRCAANFRDHEIVLFVSSSRSSPLGTKSILARRMIKCDLTLADFELQLGLEIAQSDVPAKVQRDGQTEPG
jgi:hypothetical protein